MAWGQVISWGSDETSDKWGASMASLLMGTLNGKLTGDDEVMYLNKLKGEFGDVLRQHDNHSSVAAQYFPLCKPKPRTEGWWASHCAGPWQQHGGAVLAPHCCAVLHQAGISLRTNFGNNSLVLPASQFALLHTRLLPVEQQTEHSCGAETLQYYFISIIFPS